MRVRPVLSVAVLCSAMGTAVLAQAIPEVKLVLAIGFTVVAGSK